MVNNTFMRRYNYSHLIITKVHLTTREQRENEMFRAQP